jgi:hypothetical protein
MVSKLRAVLTNAVVGEFSANEARERMLVDTELYMIADPSSGAFVNTRKMTGGDTPGEGWHRTRPHEPQT